MIYRNWEQRKVVATGKRKDSTGLAAGNTANRCVDNKECLGNGG